MAELTKRAFRTGSRRRVLAEETEGKGERHAFFKGASREGTFRSCLAVDCGEVQRRLDYKVSFAKSNGLR